MSVDDSASRSQPPEDMLGTVLDGRYRIERVIGEGGMACVYLARHVSLRTQVAVKVLDTRLIDDETQVARFLQEARATARIQHNNVVKILDFGPSDDGPVYFVMEYLEGQDISAVLERDYRLAWPRARALMLQLLSALGAAHQLGIIHRDLKPSNCLLVRGEDGSEVLKLLDFGIARVTDPLTGQVRRLTRTGAIFGTARYMAPEQAYGDPADERTDVYSAGICLYEMLTGIVPYDGTNVMRVLSRHLTEPLPQPSAMAPQAGITPAIEEVIYRALAKAREDRYPSMASFQQALAAIDDAGHAEYRVPAHPGGSPIIRRTPSLTPTPAASNDAKDGKRLQTPDRRPRGHTPVLDETLSDEVGRTTPVLPPRRPPRADPELDPPRTIPTTASRKTPRTPSNAPTAWQLPPVSAGHATEPGRSAADDKPQPRSVWVFIGLVALGVAGLGFATVMLKQPAVRPSGAIVPASVQPRGPAPATPSDHLRPGPSAPSRLAEPTGHPSAAAHQAAQAPPAPSERPTAFHDEQSSDAEPPSAPQKTETTQSAEARAARARAQLPPPPPDRRRSRRTGRRNRNHRDPASAPLTGEAGEPTSTDPTSTDPKPSPEHAAPTLQPLPESAKPGVAKPNPPKPRPSDLRNPF